MPKKNACCNDEANLRSEDTGKEELTMKRCQVCGSRHFVLKWQPIQFGVVSSE